MSRDDIGNLGRERPFSPFFIEWIDGRRFRFGSVEEFSGGRTTIESFDRLRSRVLISLVPAATITVEQSGGAA